MNTKSLALISGRFLFLIDSLNASDGLKFQFATDGEGNYGYLGADDSFIPFKGGTPQKYPETLTVSNYGTVSIPHPKMAVLYTTAINVQNFIVIANKTILYQNTTFETYSGMGFNYDATTDTLTLVNRDIGGRQFELYYV